jgi:hypothetical protein
MDFPIFGAFDPNVDPELHSSPMSNVNQHLGMYHHARSAPLSLSPQPAEDGFEYFAKSSPSDTTPEIHANEDDAWSSLVNRFNSTSDFFLDTDVDGGESPIPQESSLLHSPNSTGQNSNSASKADSQASLPHSIITIDHPESTHLQYAQASSPFMAPLWFQQSLAREFFSPAGHQLGG